MYIVEGWGKILEGGTVGAVWEVLEVYCWAVWKMWEGGWWGEGEGEGERWWVGVEG